MFSLILINNNLSQAWSVIKEAAAANSGPHPTCLGVWEARGAGWGGWRGGQRSGYGARTPMAELKGEGKEAVPAQPPLWKQDEASKLRGGRSRAQQL